MLRSHVLLGRTVDTGRVWDVAATTRYLAATAKEGKSQLVVAGKGNAGLLAAYAALLTPEVHEAVVVDPPDTHMDASTPQLLNILRVCDVPEMLGMLAPRPLKLVSGSELSQQVRSIYAAAAAEGRLTQ
jgi:hypothetical protein